MTRIVGAVILPALVGAVLVPVPLAPPSLAQPAIAGDDAAQLLHRLVDAQVPGAARDAAANRLVAADDRRALSLIESVFQADGPEHAPQRGAILAAIARTTDPASGLFPILAGFIAAGAPPDQAPAAIEALGSFRTRAAVELLLARAAPGRPSPERAAAFRALARLTGRDDLGDSHERWSVWSARLNGADDARWQAAIASGLAARADRLSADRADAVARLAEATRRLFLAFAQAPVPAEQPRLLVSLLTDPREDLRSLGFDILSRELSSARPIDPAVEKELVGLLRNASPGVRARAAQLVRHVNPPGAVDAVARALTIEESPDAASALLLAAARWPSEAVRAPALRWLPDGAEARSSAVQALLTLARSGLLHDPADRAAAAFVLRATEALTPQECRLLAAVGDQADRDRIAGILAGPSSPLRTAAAEALADDPRYFETIMALADRDLFEPAVRAVLASSPTADGLARLLLLDAPSEEARAAALQRVAAALPTAELLLAARGAELALRDMMLARLADFSIPGDATGAMLTTGLLMLVEARLALGRPDGAVAALEAMPNGASAGAAASEDLQAPINAAGTIALLWLGRINEAEDLNAAPDAWLDGLERSVSEPHARMVARVIEDRFKDGLAPAQVARLEALRKRLNQPTDGTNGPPR